jgi:hypothetical protein
MKTNIYIDGFNLYWGVLAASQFPQTLQDKRGVFHKPASW